MVPNAESQPRGGRIGWARRDELNGSAYAQATSLGTGCRLIVRPPRSLLQMSSKQRFATDAPGAPVTNVVQTTPILPDSLVLTPGWTAFVTPSSTTPSRRLQMNDICNIVRPCRPRGAATPPEQLIRRASDIHRCVLSTTFPASSSAEGPALPAAKPRAPVIHRGIHCACAKDTAGAQSGINSHRELEPIMRINSLPSLREIRSQLVLTADAPNRMAVSRASRDETLIRITRGVYLPSCLLEGYPLWFQRTIVRGSRICALAVRRSNCVLTGECAGWVLELPVCADRGPIVAYVPRHSGIRSLSFDPVRLGSKAVMPSELACLIRSTVVPERQSADGFTVPCASRVLIDCARMSTRERAFTVTCAGMARLASFSRFDQVASRERGEECRAELLQELGSLPPSTRGASQARWSISHADVGCE